MYMEHIDLNWCMHKKNLQIVIDFFYNFNQSMPFILYRGSVLHVLVVVKLGFISKRTNKKLK